MADSTSRVHVLIPAQNEELSLPHLLEALAGAAAVIVVDNGSVDRTADVAREHGARVVHEPRPGYGRACLAGLDSLGDADDDDVVAFFLTPTEVTILTSSSNSLVRSFAAKRISYSPAGR